MAKRRYGFWSACWSLDNVDCDRTAWENGWACMSGIPRVDVFVTMLAVRLGQRCRWWVSCSDEAEPVCLEGARLAGAATSRLDLDLAPMGRWASVPAACMGAGALGRVPEPQALRQSSSTWAYPTRRICPGVGIISKPTSLSHLGGRHASAAGVQAHLPRCSRLPTRQTQCPAHSSVYFNPWVNWSHSVHQTDQLTTTTMSTTTGGPA